jgi:hypothetical protein
MVRFGILLSLSLLLLVACQPSAPQDITSLEKAVASHPNEENVTVLLTLYQDSVAKLPAANPAWRTMHEKILTVSSAQKRHEVALMSAKELAVHAPDEKTKQGYVQRLRGTLDSLGKDTYLKPLGQKVFNDSIGEINTEAATRYVAACEAYALVYKGSDAASDYLYKASKLKLALCQLEATFVDEAKDQLNRTRTQIRQNNRRLELILIFSANQVISLR